MTDQTKQRMVDLIKTALPGLSDLRTTDIVTKVTLEPVALIRILAWADLQSSASAAAALRMAIDIVNAEAIAPRIVEQIEALITSAGTSALASMLEEVERKGAEQGVAKIFASHDAS